MLKVFAAILALGVELAVLWACWIWGFRLPFSLPMRIAAGLALVAAVAAIWGAPRAAGQTAPAGFAAGDRQDCHLRRRHPTGMACARDDSRRRDRPRRRGQPDPGICRARARNGVPAAGAVVRLLRLVMPRPCRRRLRGDDQRVERTNRGFLLRSWPADAAFDRRPGRDR
jgi:hypothetical protein